MGGGGQKDRKTDRKMSSPTRHLPKRDNIGHNCTLSNTKYSKLCKEARIVDKTFTMTSADIVYRKIVSGVSGRSREERRRVGVIRRGAVRLTFDEFCRILFKVATEKYTSASQAAERTRLNRSGLGRSGIRDREYERGAASQSAPTQERVETTIFSFLKLVQDSLWPVAVALGLEEEDEMSEELLRLALKSQRVAEYAWIECGGRMMVMAVQTFAENLEKGREEEYEEEGGSLPISGSSKWHVARQAMLEL